MIENQVQKRDKTFMPLLTVSWVHSLPQRALISATGFNMECSNSGDKIREIDQKEE